MNVSIVIATCGGQEWGDLAWSRAYPSANAQRSANVAVEIVIEHYPEMSVSAARNAAAASASNDWLCFLDADDELEPGYLDAMAYVESFAASERLGAPLLVPSVRYVNATPGQIAAAILNPAAGIPNRGGWPRVNECVIGTLVPRACFEHVGGFREWPSIEDYDLWLRCYDAGADLVYVEGAVYRAHVNPDGRNRDQSCYAQIWAEHEERLRACL